MQVVVANTLSFHKLASVRKVHNRSHVISAEMSGQRLVLWFRNDLRLTDNPMVHQAAQLVQTKQASEASGSARVHP